MANASFHLLLVSWFYSSTRSTYRKPDLHRSLKVWTSGGVPFAIARSAECARFCSSVLLAVRVEWHLHHAGTPLLFNDETLTEHQPTLVWPCRLLPRPSRVSAPAQNGTSA